MRRAVNCLVRQRRTQRTASIEAKWNWRCDELIRHNDDHRHSDGSPIPIGLARPEATKWRGDSGKPQRPLRSAAARIEVTEAKTVVVDRQVRQDPKGGNDDVQVNYVTKVFQVGPAVDVTPFVMEDGRSIPGHHQRQSDRVCWLRRTETLGQRDRQGNQSPPLTAVCLSPGFVSAWRMPRPRFGTDRRSSWAALFRAMCPIPTPRCPCLATFPLLGRLFRSDSSSRTNKHLILFVTPTSWTPGSRVHAPEP